MHRNFHYLSLYYLIWYGLVLPSPANMHLAHVLASQASPHYLAHSCGEVCGLLHTQHRNEMTCIIKEVLYIRLLILSDLDSHFLVSRAPGPRTLIASSVPQFHRTSGRTYWKNYNRSWLRMPLDASSSKNQIHTCLDWPQRAGGWGS